MTRTKILFVTFHDIWHAQDGGSIFSRNCYDALSEFCDIKAYRVSLKDDTRRMASVFMPFGKGVKEEIYQIADVEKADVVFFSSSLFGHVIRYLNSRAIKTICYFQNCEYDYYRSKERDGLEGSLKVLISYLAEKNAARYSDYTIGLNQRDSKRIDEIYHRNLEAIIPISLKIDRVNNEYHAKNSMHQSNVSCHGTSDGENTKTITEETESDVTKTTIDLEEPYMFFAGSNFKPNHDGIKWFIENVLPEIPIKLLVVGRDFEKSKEELEKADKTGKLEVIGSVASTTPYYQHAACVVSPIFLGSGMKVKTAEALSYGKYIFGTKEAFEGYDLDFEKIGGICYNKQDFIMKLNRFFLERAKDHQYDNPYARAVFDEKYSFESEVKALKEVVQKVIAEN